MMNRRFTTQERVLLLVLIVIFTVILYVFAVFNPTSDSINDARNQSIMLEEDIERELMKAGDLSRMRKSLQEMEDSGSKLAMIPDYDNISNVAPLLNAALAKANGFDVHFMPVSFLDNFVMREIAMQFSADSYTIAEDIIAELSEGPYSCGVSALQITPMSDGSIMSGEVTASMTITYYEVDHRLSSETEEGYV